MSTDTKRSVPWKGILRMAALILCGTILGVNVYMANARRLVGNQMPMPFGYGAAVVLSGSMEPEFSQGDLILVKEETSYETRDIVVYQQHDSLVVHRIISMDGDVVITQGDANNAPDEPITTADIKGRVLCWIPGAGNAVSFLKTPVGIFCIIAAAIALLEIPRRREMKEDDAQRQQLLDEIRRLKEEQEAQLRAQTTDRQDPQ